MCNCCIMGSGLSVSDATILGRRVFGFERLLSAIHSQQVKLLIPNAFKFTICLPTNTRRLVWSMAARLWVWADFTLQCSWLLLCIHYSPGFLKSAFFCIFYAPRDLAKFCRCDWPPVLACKNNRFNNSFMRSMNRVSNFIGIWKSQIK